MILGAAPLGTLPLGTLPAATGGVLALTALTVSNITSTGARFTVSISNNAAGTLRLAIYPAGAATPTYTIGVGWSGSPVYTDSDVDPGTGSTYQFTPDISGLSASTSYDAYAVWEDGSTFVGPVSALGWSTTSASQNIAASGAATASGTATAAAQVALSGVGVSLASGSASIAASKPLAASGVGTASGTAAPKIDIALSALGLTVASGTAALSSNASGSLAATGSATAGGSAAAVANVTISAVGLAQAAAQAGLSASVLLAGAGAAAAAGNAALAVQLQALAQGAAQASGSATLQGSTAGQLSASGQATAGGTAALRLDVRLQAAGGAQAGGSGTLSAGDAATLAASGGAASSGSGALSAAISLTAAGFVQAMGAGSLIAQVPIGAIGAARAAGSATLPGTEPPNLFFITPGRRAIAASRTRTVSARPRAAVSHGRNVMAKFDAKDPDETYTVLFDFFELLDSIDSASCAATVVTGTDTNPSAILIGLPQVSGTKVVQRVAGGLDDVQYRIRCMVTSGPDTFVLTGIQPVEVAE